jgi:predicted RNA-binding Zn ribbon-like protein
VSPKESSKLCALFLAGHPALDFLNTRMRVNEDLVDLLQSDEDVFTWLKQAGFSAPTIAAGTGPLALLRCARRLRESMRSLVEERKAGRQGDPSILNSFLAASQSYPQLVWKKSSTPTIDTVRRQDTAESILAPVAEAAADLLTTADFKLVKRCEDETCVLWFCDQTKSPLSKRFAWLMSAGALTAVHHRREPDSVAGFVVDAEIGQQLTFSALRRERRPSLLCQWLLRWRGFPAS